MTSFEAAHKGHLIADAGMESQFHFGEGSAPAPEGPLGRGLVDKMTHSVGNRLRAISPLLGEPYDDGGYLRSLLGNLYLVLPVLGAVLGFIAILQSKGMAVPPSVAVTIALMTLGVLDAFSGMVAWIIFALGVVFSGHFFSTHVLRGPIGHQGMLYVYSSLFALALLWFIGPQLPRKMRPVLISKPTDRFGWLYATLADYFVIPFLGVLILGSLPALLPSLTGAAPQGLTQVIIQDYLTPIKIAIALSLAVRVGLEYVAHSRYARLPLTVAGDRPTSVKRLTKAASALLALLLIWEVMGSMWQTYAVWLSFVFSEQITALGERFLKPSVWFRYLPRNLFKILLLILFSQVAMKYLNGQFVSGTSILGWLAISLAVVTTLYAVLETAAIRGDAEDEEWPRWVTRTGGVLSVLGLFLVSQGLVGIEAKPYASPHGIATNLAGSVYVADSGNSRVIRISADGTRSTVGSGLNNPFGVTLNPSSAKELALVADTGNNRVLEISAQSQALAIPARFTLSYASAADTQHTVGSGYKSPTAVTALPNGTVYVADAGNNRIVEITPSGHQRTFAANIQDPQAVYADPFGRLWVTDTGRGIVRRYVLKKDGSAQSSVVFARGLSQPSGVAVDAVGNVFISNTGRNTVYEYRTDGTRETVHGDFFTPGQISVNASGHAYITNVSSSEVSVVTPIYVGKSYDAAPRDVGTAVAVAKDLSLYVVSATAGTLEHIQGNTITVVASGLHNPNGVALSATGQLYVSQTGTGEVDHVSSTGALTPIATGLSGITAITPDSYGGLVGVSTSRGTLYTISPQGEVHALVQHLDSPTDVTFDAYGSIDVALAGTKKHTGSVVRIVPGQPAQLIAQGLDAVIGITADKYGNVFYVEDGTHRIWENMGALGTQICVEGSVHGAQPQALGADGRGNVYVLQRHPNRVVRYNLAYQSNPM